MNTIEHWSVAKQAVVSKRGVVAAQDQRAAAVGARVLGDGGNAVDAAVATAFALGVVEPWMCGLGGSGYLLVWNAATKRAEVFDFQGVLAGATDPAQYPLDPMVPVSTMGFPGVKNELNTVGYRSVSIPGAVRGLCEALDAYGAKKLDAVLSPVIDLARAGVGVSWFTTLQIALAARELQADKAAGQLFMPGGNPLLPDSVLHNKPLTRSLETLAAQGPDAMYGGSLGARMVEDLQAGGSVIALEDFARYQVVRSESLCAEHRGYQVHTAGATSGGPRLLDTLKFVEAQLDVNRGIGPHSWLVYARALSEAWRAHSERIGRATEVSGCTTHLSVVDEAGNMVALTYTLLSRFGSGVLLPQTGILMNNAVSYFDPRPGYPTSMASGRRINASNMCPTIAVRDNGDGFAVGASGANFIMPCTTIITALMIDFGLSLEAAFNCARLDVSEAGRLRADPLLGDDVINTLSEEFALEQAQRLVFPKLYAGPSGVSRNGADGTLCGINDPSQPVGAAVAAERFE
jgi:gamma-glutamyltranspeptidase/glutathione hydrolase